MLFQIRKFYDASGASCSLNAKTQAPLPETAQFLYGFWRQITVTSISHDVFQEALVNDPYDTSTNSTGHISQFCRLHVLTNVITRQCSL